MKATQYPHLDVDERGRPIVAGTRTKVIQIVIDHVAQGWEAGEIHRQHAYLSMPVIHSALAFYYDHKEQLDQEMVEMRDEIDKFFASRPAQSTRSELQRRLAVRQGNKS